MGAIRDLAILGGVTVVILSLMLRGSVSEDAGALALVLAPVILGAGRGTSGCLGHIVRILTVFSLPVLALVGLLDLPDLPLRDTAVLLASVTVLVIVLYGLHVMFGGGTRAGFWRFLGLIPLLLLIVGSGAIAGTAPSAIALLLVLVLALRRLSASRFIAERAGRRVEPRFRIVWQVGSAIVALILFSYVTSDGQTGASGTLTAGLVLTVVALQGAVYFIVGSAAEMIRE